MSEKRPRWGSHHSELYTVGLHFVIGALHLDKADIHTLEPEHESFHALILTVKYLTGRGGRRVSLPASGPHTKVSA